MMKITVTLYYINDAAQNSSDIIFAISFYFKNGLHYLLVSLTASAALPQTMLS